MRIRAKVVNYRIGERRREICQCHLPETERSRVRRLYGRALRRDPTRLWPAPTAHSH